MPAAGAEGVIIAQGGRFGGWARLRQGRQAEVRLQRARHPRVRHRVRGARPGRRAPGADGVRVRRRRARQGRRRHPLLRRDRDRVRSGPGDPADDLLRRRDHGHRLRVGHLRDARLHRRPPATSPARSTGCRSTSGTTTTTTSSTPRSGSASPWPGSDRHPSGVTSRAGVRSCPRPIRPALVPCSTTLRSTVSATVAEQPGGGHLELLQGEHREDHRGQAAWAEPPDEGDLRSGGTTTRAGPGRPAASAPRSG